MWWSSRKHAAVKELGRRNWKCRRKENDLFKGKSNLHLLSFSWSDDFAGFWAATGEILWHVRVSKKECCSYPSEQLRVECHCNDDVSMWLMTTLFVFVCVWNGYDVTRHWMRRQKGCWEMRSWEDVVLCSSSSFSALQSLKTLDLDLRQAVFSTLETAGLWRTSLVNPGLGLT